MAAVLITGATNRGYEQRGQRQSFRNSAGNLYVMAGLNAYGQDPNTGAWTNLDTANRPTNTGVASQDADINALNQIGLVYHKDATTIAYALFAADGSDAWVSSEDIATITTATTLGGETIAFDRNGYPHVTFKDGLLMYYANRVAGSWTAVPVAVSADGDTLTYANLLITAAGIPIIIAYNVTQTKLYAYLGNQNNATSFTAQAITAALAANLYGHSSVIDAAGDIWVARAANLNGTVGSALTLIQHKSADNWATWQSEVTVDATLRNVYPSVAAQGTRLHIICQQTNVGLSTKAGLIYHTNITGTWVTTALLESGNVFGVKCRWGYPNRVGYNMRYLDYTFWNTDDNEQYWNYLNTARKGLPVPRVF